MAPGQKDILPRFTIILFVMALMAIAVIAKAGFIMFAERGYWEEVADRSRPLRQRKRSGTPEPGEYHFLGRKTDGQQSSGI